MSTSGIKDSDKSSGYFLKLGVFPFLLMLLVFLVTLFIFNLSAQYSELEQSYQTLSTWYIYIGLFTFALLGFIVAKEHGKKYQTVVFDDPHRTWRDFASVLVGALAGMGGFALMTAGLPFEQVIKIPEPILQLIVASVEELAFRLVLPAIIYMALHESKINLNAMASFVLAILFANIGFAVFHYASYSITIANAQEILAAGGLTEAEQSYYESIAAISIERGVISAFAFGMMQSLAFFAAVRLFSSGGEWAICGVIAGHYAWNLLITSIQQTGTAAMYNPWQYLGVFLMVIFFFMFVIGYFFKPRRIKSTRRGSPTLTAHKRSRKSKKYPLSFIMNWRK